MIIINQSKNEKIFRILKAFVENKLLTEADLDGIRQLIQQQRAAKKSPTKDGSSERPSNGFYNHNKHVQELIDAGISPEFVGLKFKRLDATMYGWGPIGVERAIGDYPVAEFKTKSYARQMGDKKGKFESYTQYIVFGDWAKLARNPHLSLSQKVTELLKGEQSYHCSCMSDSVHYGYAKHQRDDDKFLEPTDQQLIPAPIRNPKGIGGICKHLDLVYNPEFQQNVWGPKFLQEMMKFFKDKDKDKRKEKEPSVEPKFSPGMQKRIDRIGQGEDPRNVLGKFSRPGTPGSPYQGPLQRAKLNPKQKNQPTKKKEPEPFSKEWFQKHADEFEEIEAVNQQYLDKKR